jgi:hypothetical protein
MSDKLRRLATTWLPGLLVLAVLLTIYSGTLQRDVNSSDNGYTLDVGEIQVALNLWGTIHYTGYPLFTLLGSLLTHILRLVGLSPAAAASAVAMGWSLAGLAALYLLLVRLTKGERGLAALLVLTLGLVETVWVHSVVIEVYSFSSFVVSLSLLLALDLGERWSDRQWWWLVLLLGVGAQHHRLLLALVPVTLLMIWPRLWERRPRWLLFGVKSLVVFVLPFLAYLYLPLRAFQGARWVYGQPGTWDGFWAQFTGEEVTPYVLGWPKGLPAWLDNGRFLIEQMQQQIPIMIALAGLGGLIWLVVRRDSRMRGLAFLVGAGAFQAFVLAFPKGVWAPAVLMPAVVFLALGLAWVLGSLAKRVTAARWVAWGGLLILAVWLFRANLPSVLSLTRDGRGREVVQTLEPLSHAELPGGEPIVVLPWGGDYFAAAYGLYVTGELDGFGLVDHRAPLWRLAQEEGKLLTLVSHLGYWPLDWWTDLFGEAHYSSAAPGVAMVSRQVLYADVPADVGFDLGNGVHVRDARLTWYGDDRLQVTVFWEAAEEVDADYRVAIHLVSQDPPEGGHHILAQADAVNPVGGWYPVTLWELGEVVRDDYALDVVPGVSPVAVRIAMYRVGDSGTFVNTEWLSLAIPE